MTILGLQTMGFTSFYKKQTNKKAFPAFKELGQTQCFLLTASSWEITNQLS